MAVDGKQFTSNTSKLLQHLDKLQGMKDGVQSPVMIHVAPTNLCNLECTYCCYAARNDGTDAAGQKNSELSESQVRQVLRDFRKFGVKGLEWTGGGDPSLWRPLDKMIVEASEMGYKQGLITNAIKGDWIHRYDLLEWTRVSLHGFNEGKEVLIAKNVDRMRSVAPDMTISGTYIWTHGSEEVFPRVAQFVQEYKIPTRVTPDLTLGKQSIDAMMKHVGDNVKYNGSDYTFLSDFNVQTTRRDDHCYMAMVKPFIFPDGWVYVCPSIGLTPDTDKNVGNEYRVCRIEDIVQQYSKPAAMRNHDCGYCKYSQQNELIDDILRPVTHKDFA